MSSDTSDLYTGITSVMSRKVTASRMSEARKSLEEKNKVQPSGSDLIELIHKHKADIALHVMDTINADSTDETVGKVSYSAKEMYKFLNGFEQEVKLILRERPEVSNEE